MDSVIRGVVVYLFLLVVLRLAGKRTIGEMTPFDLILTLIISETLQQALIDSDNSLTNALLLVLTLVGTTVVLSLLKQKSQVLQRLLDGVPVIVVEKGRMHQDRMDALRIDEADIMSQARQQEGLKSLDEIDFAVVEDDGKISVIPRQGGKEGGEQRGKKAG